MTLIDARLEGDDLPAPEAVIPPALERAITELTLFLERETKLRTPIGVTSVARGSIGHRIQRGGSAARGVRIRSELGSPARHVEVLRGGRRAGAKRPPSDALELWVRRRLGITDPDEVRSAAFVIARAIGRRGQDGLRMFERAVDENADTVRRILDGAGVQISVRYAGGA